MHTLEIIDTADPVLQSIIFDMDGVLCDSEGLVAESAIELFLQMHGQVVKAKDFEPFIGTGEERYLGGVAEKYSLPFKSPDHRIKLYEIYLERIKGRLQALPGVLELVQAVRERGLKTAVATSADRVKLDGNLEEIGLPAKQFDAAVTATDITRPKPDPEIFFKVCEYLQLEPSTCLVIEDSVHGIEAARAAGCRTLGVGHTFPTEKLAAAGADWVVPHFNV